MGSRPSPGSAAAPPSPGRLAALQVLVGVEQGGMLDDLLPAHAPPSRTDRALTWHLAKGVQRRRGELDAVISHLARRPAQALDPVPLSALRIGLFEIRHGRVPPHAAVNEAVGLCRAGGSPWTAGLVNAVLRRHARAPDLDQRQLLSHPDWLLRRWEARYGQEAAWAWARRNNEPAPLSLVARLHQQQETKEGLEAEGWRIEPARAGGEPVPGVFLVPGATGAVSHLPGFREGRFWIQDAAATAVADLLSIQPGLAVLDACAAPGGKSFRLADKGALVTAVDRSPERLADVEEGARRVGLGITTCAHDWTTGPMGGDRRFPAVLVDAPCTGLGTLRRHPDIRWRRTPADLAANHRLQLAILSQAAVSVEGGGELVYAVCSPEPEEGQEVVGVFLERNEGFSLARTFCSTPPEADEDGFFAALMARR